VADLDIAKRQQELQKLDDEIAAEEAKFQAALEPLHQKKQDLEREYAKFLRSELAAINGISAPRSRSGSSKVDDEAIIGHLRRASGEQSATQIRDAIGYDGSSNAFSVALKTLVDSGQIKRVGQRRGSRYLLSS
jgi:hypothetical protein